MRKVLAIDFDGTLCENEYPGIGEPHKWVIEAAKRRKENGWALILWTCRTDQTLEDAVKWCSKHGLEFDAINDNIPEWKEMFGNNPRKIGATQYWDDRGVDLGGIREIAERLSWR